MPFGNDLLQDLIPQIDASFRTISKPQARAMAGLSMGGAHTIRFGLTHPEVFNPIGIFSMGLGMGGNQEEITRYQTENAAALARGARDFRVVYYAIGKDDFLHATSAPTRAILDHSGIKYAYNESSGGHTWINWRRYLNDFLPLLF
jgi:enterochelin esterase-like enzyme